jgi:hypothetical protein
MNFEYILAIPKAISSLLFILIALKIYSMQKDYLLNKIYLITFLTMGFYIILDIAVYLMAPLSSSAYEIANIMFSIQMALLVLFIFLVIQATRVIEKSTTSLFNNTFWIQLIICIVVAILIIIVKNVIVIDDQGNIIPPELLPPTVEGFKATNGTNEGYTETSTLLISSIPLVLVIYAIGVLFNIRSKIAPEDPVRAKMLWFIVGITLVPLGLIYFILIAIVGLQDYVSITMGYLFWIISPFLIWKSQSQNKQK